VNHVPASRQCRCGPREVRRPGRPWFRERLARFSMSSMTASAADRTRWASSESKIPQRTISSNSSSSFHRHDRSGSTTTSNIRSIASNPIELRRIGRCMLTYQPRCDPSARHDTQIEYQSPGRRIHRLELLRVGDDCQRARRPDPALPHLLVHDGVAACPHARSFAVVRCESIDVVGPNSQIRLTPTCHRTANTRMRPC
jgi:hypothetical protein